MKGKIIELVAIKIGLLGDSGVGKSSICNTYTGIEFNPDLLVTIGTDRFEKKINLKNGKEIKLVFWDTAGEERFRSAAYKAIRSVQGIILVFNLTERNTFKNIDSYLADIRDNFDNPFIVIFGNKSDIEEREVSREEIEQYMKQKKLVYFETSAKYNQGINEGFSYIANEVYEKFSLKDTNQIKIGKGDDDYEIINGCFGKKKRRKKKIK